MTTGFIFVIISLALVLYGLPPERGNMLVLSRKRDEAIMIGDEVEVVVLDIRGDKVRLGINAPRRIPVHRKEVYEAIKKDSS